MKLLSLFVLAVPLLAQSGSLSWSCSSAQPGSVMTCTLSLANAAAPAPAPNAISFNFGLSFPCTSACTMTPGSAAVQVSDGVTCNAGFSPCLVWGVNASTIPSGPIAVFTLPVPTTVAVGSNITVGATSPLGVGLNGGSVMENASAVNIVVAANPCKLASGAGPVGLADVQQWISWFMMTPANTAADLNHDGTVDVRDLEIVIKAALGQPCNTAVVP